MSHKSVSITTNDGVVVVGKNAADVVRKLKACQWNAPDRKLEYMEEVVERVEMMTDVTPVRPVFQLTPLKFLQYLVDAGVAKWTEVS